jgi:hypothetical protein
MHDALQRITADNLVIQVARIVDHR